MLRQFPQFKFHRVDLAHMDATRALFAEQDFGPVVHLAAQAGVRYSLENPHAYGEANLAGFLNVLEGCRARKTPASGLRIVEFGLRRQYENAVLGAR